MATATANMKMVSYDSRTGIAVYEMTLDGVKSLFARKFIGKMKTKMDRLWAKQQDD